MADRILKLLGKQPQPKPEPTVWEMVTRVRQQGTIAMTMFLIQPKPQDGRTIYVSDEHLASRILAYLNLTEGTADA